MGKITIDELGHSSRAISSNENDWTGDALGYPYESDPLLAEQSFNKVASPAFCFPEWLWLQFGAIDFKKSLHETWDIKITVQ